MLFSLTNSLNECETLSAFLDERIEAYCLDKHIVKLFLEENREFLQRAWYVYNSRDLKRVVKARIIEDTYSYLAAEVNCLEDTHFEIVGIMSLDARRQLFQTFSDYMLEKPKSTELLIDYAESMA